MFFLCSAASSFALFFEINVKVIIFFLDAFDRAIEIYMYLICALVTPSIGQEAPCARKRRFSWNSSSGCMSF